MHARLSNDGRRLAVAIRDSQSANLDVWVHEFTRGTATRLTFDPGREESPIWSPDDVDIVYNAETQALRDLFIKKSSGEGTAELLHQAQSHKFPTDFSPSGDWIAFDAFDLQARNGWDVLVLSRSDGKVVPLAATQHDERFGRFSPDGKWIAYVSNESGRMEVYVQRWPGTGGAKWQVSTGGGTTPHWRRDGREIFYRSLTDEKIMSVPISAGASFEAGQPDALFETKLRFPSSWDVSPDGQRFLLNREIREGAPNPLTVVLNWTEGLQK
jgi:eukaryotic-like serine/threonine-protein kinase